MSGALAPGLWVDAAKCLFRQAIKPLPTATPRRALACVLLGLLFGQPVAALAAAPDDPATLPDAPLPQPNSLQIVILDGEGALNNIRQRTAREPIVQVEDENHKPVAGVLILFSSHSGATGAGATFNGLSSLSVTTGADGRAVAHGLTPNDRNGAFTIAVVATLGALIARAVIQQTNTGGEGPPESTPGATTRSPVPLPPPVAAGNPPAAVHHGIVHTLTRPAVLAGAAAAAIALVVLVTVRTNSTDISVGAGGVGHP